MTRCLFEQGVRMQPGWRQCLSAVLLVGLASPCVSARQQDGDVSASGRVGPARGVVSDPRNDPSSLSGGLLFDFDIAAQPLAMALDRYASLTQRAAVFRSEIVAGRRSSAVRGRYTPEQALTLMLARSGVMAEKTQTGPSDAFVLKAVTEPVPTMQAALAAAGDYPGLVQVQIWEALCRNTGTRPGDYRALLRFRVDRRGQVAQVRVLGSTGNATRDAAVQLALERVRMDRTPPPGMPQPLTMLILPHGAQAAGNHPGCSQ